MNLKLFDMQYSSSSLREFRNIGCIQQKNQLKSSFATIIKFLNMIGLYI